MQSRMPSILICLLLISTLCVSSDGNFRGSAHNTSGTNDSTGVQKSKRRDRKDKAFHHTPIIRSLRIAFCVTGQLARLELHSKIKNVIAANANLGHTVHTFVYLDDEVDNVKQTYWKFNYSTSLYGTFSSQVLKTFIDTKIGEAKVDRRHNIKTWVRLEPPPRYNFEVFWNESVPVTEKKFTGHDGSKENYESAESRFQNNMRWMSGLRECAKWVQEAELSQGIFYDIVVRLREDSYALGPWHITADKYLGLITSLDLGASRGINDHNFAVDRRWINEFLRGLSEDYYFNHTKVERWLNPEQHLLQVAQKYHIPLRTANICEMPLIPLRGLLNTTYWRVHPLYVRYLSNSCPYLPNAEQNPSRKLVQKVAISNKGNEKHEKSNKLDGDDNNEESNTEKNNEGEENNKKVSEEKERMEKLKALGEGRKLERADLQDIRANSCCPGKWTSVVESQTAQVLM